MSDLDAVADKEIAELDARLGKFAKMRAAKIIEKDQLTSGSLPHIELMVEIEAIDRSIRHLQDLRAKWILGKATRRLLSARRA